MNRSILSLALVAAAPPALATPVDGTWKADVASAKLPAKPDVYALAGGTYRCVSCAPAWAVKADGAFHAIAGHAYADAVAIRIVDARTVEEQDRLAGKVTSATRLAVAADGRTLTRSWTDYSAPNGKPAHGTAVEVRVGTPLPGQHAVAGSWRATKVADVSDQALTGTYRQQGNRLVFSTPDGFGYTAELGGRPVTMIGSPASQTIAVKALPNGLVETNYDVGTVANVRTTTLLPGGRQVRVVEENRKKGTTTSYVMNKVG